jgi:hypothetical protein
MVTPAEDEEETLENEEHDLGPPEVSVEEIIIDFRDVVIFRPTRGYRFTGINKDGSVTMRRIAHRKRTVAN